jgi:hypothetical protein
VSKKTHLMTKGEGGLQQRLNYETMQRIRCATDEVIRPRCALPLHCVDMEGGNLRAMVKAVPFA